MATWTQSDFLPRFVSDVLPFGGRPRPRGLTRLDGGWKNSSNVQSIASQISGIFAAGISMTPRSICENVLWLSPIASAKADCETPLRSRNSRKRCPKTARSTVTPGRGSSSVTATGASKRFWKITTGSYCNIVAGSYICNVQFREPNQKLDGSMMHWPVAERDFHERHGRRQPAAGMQARRKKRCSRHNRCNACNPTWHGPMDQSRVGEVGKPVSPALGRNGGRASFKRARHDLDRHRDWIFASRRRSRRDLDLRQHPR